LNNIGTQNFVVDHITINSVYTDLLVSNVHYGFQWTNNLMPQGTYGMIVSFFGQGPVALGKDPTRAFPDGIITNNSIVGPPGTSSLYPPGNFFYQTFADAILAHPELGDRTIHVNPTTTTLTSSVNPSFFGQPVTFTAMVFGPPAPFLGMPTGTVS